MKDALQTRKQMHGTIVRQLHKFPSWDALSIPQRRNIIRNIMNACDIELATRASKLVWCSKHKLSMYLLMHAFPWNTSIEGCAYWNELYHSLANVE